MLRMQTLPALMEVLTMLKRFIARRLRILPALGFFASLLCCAQIRAADCFLHLSSIPGESTVPGHENDIDLQSYSWQGVSVPPVIGGGGSSKAVFKDLSLTKYVDKSSPKLMLACASGQ